MSLSIFRIETSVSFLLCLWWQSNLLHDLYIRTGDEMVVHNDVKCIFQRGRFLHGAGLLHCYSFKYYAGKGMFKVVSLRNLFSNLFRMLRSFMESVLTQHFASMDGWLHILSFLYTTGGLLHLTPFQATQRLTWVSALAICSYTGWFLYRQV